jgi:sporulation integral membrane protein YtvI
MEHREYKEIAILAAVSIAVYVGLKYLLPPVAPFLVSGFLAWCLLPAVSFLKKRLHITKGFSSSLLIAGLIAGLAFLAAVFGRLFLTQLAGLVQSVPYLWELFQIQTKKLCCYSDTLFRLKSGASMELLESGIKQVVTLAQTTFLPELSKQTFFGIGKLFFAGWLLFLIFLGAFFIIKDSEDLKIIWEESFWYQKGSGILEKLAKTGLAYIRAQLLIMGLTGLICTLGLFILGNPYCLLLGCIIALLDALPAIGSGVILLPWCIFKLFCGEVFPGVMLFFLYVVCLILRQYLESKILDDRTGLKPIFTLMAMYAGVRLFGVFGFILGPVALLMIRTILQSLW